MAVDKLVDSTQLDADLTSVANAIRIKGGTSASLAFPADLVSAIQAIPTGGGDWLDDYLTGTTTEIIYTGTSNIMGITFGKNTIQKFVGTKTTRIGVLFAWNTGIKIACFPKLVVFDNNGTFNGNSNLEIVDLGPVTWVPNQTFQNCTKLGTLILRRTNGVSALAGVAVLATGTPFKSGGAGGTIYIPTAMYNHLGDGTSLDYKAATNWSTIDGYGTITWAKLEGSIYESEDWWDT